MRFGWDREEGAPREDREWMISTRTAETVAIGGSVVLGCLAIAVLLSGNDDANALLQVIVGLMIVLWAGVAYRRLSR